MEIVFVFDRNYIPFFLKCRESILKHNKNVNFTVVTNDDISLDGVSVIKMTNLPKDLKHRRNDRITDATYLKLCLPLLYPKYLGEKILYMDTDIICQGSLKELWKTDCDFICLTESHKYGRVQARELNHQKYGLTGVMLMNLKALNEINFTNRCFQPFEKTVSKWCHEETILNTLFYGKLKFVDKKFNYCHNRDYDDPIREEDAILLHYCGGRENKQDMLERKL